MTKHSSMKVFSVSSFAQRTEPAAANGVVVSVKVRLHCGSTPFQGWSDLRHRQVEAYSPIIRICSLSETVVKAFLPAHFKMYSLALSIVWMLSQQDLNSCWFSVCTGKALLGLMKFTRSTNWSLLMCPEACSWWKCILKWIIQLCITWSSMSSSLKGSLMLCMKWLLGCGLMSISSVFGL